MTDSQELLAEYARTGSDAAFHELVSRYVDLVYSTALRLVRGDTHRAEDVAQVVFADLARRAPTLSGEVLLGGWLHRHTCFVAANAMRRERRRESRERQLVEMNSPQDDSGPDFSPVAPLLDQAINELGEADRTAVLLRFFEQRDFRSVGEALGSNEDAARMRVNRALEKLQQSLKRHGVTTSAAALGIGLSANAVQAAPAGLAATLCGGAGLAGISSVATSAGATATKAIAMTTLQKTLIGVTLVAAVGTGVYQTRQAFQLREQVQTLRLRENALAEQVRQLRHERDAATNRLAKWQQQGGPASAQSAELLRLRAQVTRLQNDAQAANDPVDQAAQSWLTRVNELKQWAAENPAAAIPEFQLLTKQDWLDAARGNLKTDTDYRRAMSSLRGAAEDKFASQLEKALTKYQQANNGQFPTALDQLQAFFDSPVDEAILQRWEIVPAKTFPNMGFGKPNVITEKGAVDDLLDSRDVVGPRGYGSSDFLQSEIGGVLKPVYKAYGDSHGGNWTAFSVTNLLNFAKTPAQQAAVQKLMEQAALRRSDTRTWRR